MADANEVAGKVTTITVSAANTETTVTVGTVDYTINAGDGTMSIADETDALAAALVAAGYDAVSDGTSEVTVYSEATFTATANTAVAATASKNNKVAK
ncbi:hypothetical protein J5751_06525 [bacterium]|nr:hypothetical protein [bacterium]